jgi:hypothetical protein
MHMNPPATCWRVYITPHSVFSTYDLFVQYPVRKSESYVYFRSACVRPCCYAFVLGLCGYSAPAEMSVHSPAHVASNGVASVYSMTDLPSSLCRDFATDPPHMHASADAGMPYAEVQH